jgi:hypothetical protein
MPNMTPRRMNASSRYVLRQRERPSRPPAAPRPSQRRPTQRDLVIASLLSRPEDE